MPNLYDYEVPEPGDPGYGGGNMGGYGGPPQRGGYGGPPQRGGYGGPPQNPDGSYEAPEEGDPGYGQPQQDLSQFMRQGPPQRRPFDERIDYEEIRRNAEAELQRDPYADRNAPPGYYDDGNGGFRIPPRSPEQQDWIQQQRGGGGGFLPGEMDGWKGGPGNWQNGGNGGNGGINPYTGPADQWQNRGGQIGSPWGGGGYDPMQFNPGNYMGGGYGGDFGRQTGPEWPRSQGNPQGYDQQAAAERSLQQYGYQPPQLSPQQGGGGGWSPGAAGDIERQAYAAGGADPSKAYGPGGGVMGREGPPILQKVNQIRDMGGGDVRRGIDVLRGGGGGGGGGIGGGIAGAASAAGGALKNVGSSIGGMFGGLFGGGGNQSGGGINQALIKAGIKKPQQPGAASPQGGPWASMMSGGSALKPGGQGYASVGAKPPTPSIPSAQPPRAY